MLSLLHVSSGPASSLLTKRALLSCRLPEPLEPYICVVESGIAEGETDAFRAPLPELKEWTRYPEEGSPGGSVGLLDGIKTYAAHVDSTDARYGPAGAMGVDNQSGPWVMIGWNLGDVDPLVS